MQRFETLDWVVIGGYFMLLVGVAVWAMTRKQKNTEDYFLAGRNLGWFVVGASIFASNIGSEHVVGDGVGHRVEELGLFEHDVGAARGRTCVGIGPAIARCDDAHFGEAEIEHGPGRLADILAELRADEDDDRRRRGAAHSNLPGSGGSPTSSAISAKSLASEKSR